MRVAKILFQMTEEQKAKILADEEATILADRAIVDFIVAEILANKENLEVAQILTQKGITILRVAEILFHMTMERRPKSLADEEATILADRKAKAINVFIGAEIENQMQANLRKLM